MIEFRSALQERLTSILTTAVGPGSDPREWIKTFDDHLHDVDITGLPFLVVNVRTTEKLAPGEIGNRFQRHTWAVHVYYLDIETIVGNYHQADVRRDHILSRIEKELELRKFLQLDDNVALRTTDTDGHTEVVYDSSIQLITWDQSGQDGHQSFVSELYLEVYTDRS